MEISQLLSQLEEPKLLMLIRHLIDDDVRFRFDRLRAVPLDLPDAEVHAKMHLKIGSMQSNCALWFFQLSHVPACLWDDRSAAQRMRMRMRQAFESLKTRPNLVKILRRESEPDELFRGALPENYFSPMYGPDYYYFSNYSHSISDDRWRRFLGSHINYSPKSSVCPRSLMCASESERPRHAVNLPPLRSANS